MMIVKSLIATIAVLSLLCCSDQSAYDPNPPYPHNSIVKQVSKPVDREARANPLGWTTVYLASWEHNAGTPFTNWGSLSASDIDFTGITHLIYFAMNVGEDGSPGESLDPIDRYNFTNDRFQDIVPVAHKHNVDILFSVGGAGNYNGFSRAISSPQSRFRLIQTIIHLIKTYGFDGVDLDMEPIEDRDRANYTLLVEELTNQLNQLHTQRGNRPLLTAAINGQFRIFAELQSYFDQINLMTYDLSGPWRGWQTWHNSPLYSDGVTFASTGEQMPSVDQWIDYALDAGIEPGKLGLGIDFYGYIWNGVSKPGEGWFYFTPPTLEEERGGTPYRTLYSRFDLQKAEWDSIARVPYISREAPAQFVSFDNERSIDEKVRYTAERGLGGVMVWELSAGYLKDPVRGGNSHPLLRAVHQSTLKYRQQNKSTVPE